MYWIKLHVKRHIRKSFKYVAVSSVERELPIIIKGHKTKRHKTRIKHDLHPPPPTHTHTILATRTKKPLHVKYTDGQKKRYIAKCSTNYSKGWGSGHGKLVQLVFMKYMYNLTKFYCSVSFVRQYRYSSEAWVL